MPVVNAEALQHWRDLLEEIRLDIERAQKSKDMQAETAWFDAIGGFEQLDTELGEAWVEAQRQENL